MENSILYRTAPMRLILILFKITSLLIVLILIALLFLKIDDTVYFDSGVVYSKNPKNQINSPTDAVIEAIKVYEGQEVKKGDTLILLKNKKVELKHHISTSKIGAIAKKTAIISAMIAKALEEKKIYKQQLKIQTSTFRIAQLSLRKEVYNLRNKLSLSEQDSLLTQSKYKTDSLLYSKGIISRIQFEKQKKIVLRGYKKQAEAQLIFDKKKYELGNLYNKNAENIKNIEKQILNLSREIDNYQLQITKLNADTKNLGFDLDYIDGEKNKLTISAPYDGTIPFLFNTKENTTTVTTGTPLVIISPKEEKFYAKINLREECLLYLKKGQHVRLKFDAYNYYKFGGIQGTISYVTPSEIDNSFYCIVSFDKKNPNINLKAGYTIKGNIVIGSLRSYEYIFKKIFEKL